MAEIYQLPSENSGNAGMGNIPFSIPIGGFGGGLFGGNYGMNGIADLFGLAIIASMFGGGWGSPSTGTDYLKKTLEEDGNKNKEEVYAIPLSGNKAE